MITYKITYSLTGEAENWTFDRTTPLKYLCDIEGDEHELYFVMPGEHLEPWMCPLVPTDNSDKNYLRFLHCTGLDNFWWVPTGKRITKEYKGVFASNDAVERFSKL